MSERVLILEDEPVIGLEIEDVIRAAGYETVLVASVDCASAKIAAAEFGCAVLDANLRGERVDKVALALQARQTPFLFVSGYGRQALPSCCPDAVLLPKPFQPQQLISQLKALLRQRPPGRGAAAVT
jgi:DNA-binding response OmpR family regulator